MILVSDNITADYKQIEDAFVRDLNKMRKDGASSSIDMTKTSSGMKSPSTHVIPGGKKDDTGKKLEQHDSTPSWSATPTNLPVEPEIPHKIEILETLHVPGDYFTRHENLLKDIVQKTKDKTRSKYRNRRADQSDSCFFV